MQEKVRSMDSEITDVGLSSNWLTMGKLLGFSKPLFSHLLWMRGPIPQNCYAHHVMQGESLPVRTSLINEASIIKKKCLYEDVCASSRLV